ncbi:MAG: aminoacyltransferase, partial [Clostridiales bacterium]|nr:aminoacyltransferase [Clostridiales bacterium]
MISDIYFDDNYGKLYEDIEKGSAIIFNFENQYGKIKHQFIKRKIPIYINDNIYYDIITPYGYGGPIILECVPGKQKDLIEGFYKDFKIFCNNNFIVSEFIRFHPIFNNAQLFNDIYDVCFDRKTLGTNLKNFDDPIKAEFSKSCRKNIRQALNKGVGYRIIKAPEDVSTFKDIYYSTMDRNKAKSFYYFNDDYFNKALHYFKNNIVLVEALFGGKTIAAGFYFIYDKIIHMHLSGSLNEYLYLSPAYILRYAI